MRRTARLVLAGLSLAALSLLSTPATAGPRGEVAIAPAPGEHRGVKIIGRNSWRCLNSPVEHGGNVMLVNCGSGWGSELWNIEPVRDQLDVFVVVNAGTRGCLEITGSSGEDGGSASTMRCHRDLNQQWRIRANGDVLEFRNVRSQRCLDARLRVEWSDVYQWGCHGGREQQWFFTATRP